MSLRKLKAWFQRHRRGAEGPAANRQPEPQPPQTHTPVNAAGPVNDTAGRPARKNVAKQPHATPATETRNAAASPARVEHGGRPLSRQGIPVLKPDEDLAAHFNDAGAEDAPPRKVAEEADKPVQGRTGRPPGSSPRNRLGIRRLADDADLSALFMPGGDTPADENLPVAPPAPAAKPGERTRRADIPTNRHGIPRLDSQADLQRLFDASVEDTGDGRALSETLHRSLAHDARGLMKKKTGGFFPTRRMSLKEKLQRYPGPQAQLDLHGATAAKARERAASFIRTSQADGLYTLRIIVGKGRHSADGPVLPDVIEDLLLELKRNDVVLSYRWEKRTKSKSGAVIVFLGTGFAPG